jgi:hypothetical protein
MSSKFIRGLPFPRNGRGFPASRPGPVQAERSEPKGSLDGWPRCQTFVERGNGRPALSQLPTSKVVAFSPRFHSHFF